MASRYEEKLKALAVESDDDKRLELAADIDKEVEELDVNWNNKETYATLEAERDAAIKERDAIKEKYTQRFFDGDVLTRNPGEPKKPEEKKPLGYAALW